MQSPAPRSTHHRLARALLAALTVLTAVVLATTKPAGASPTAEEQDFFNQTNDARAQNGLGPLSWDEGLANIARGWSSSMAGSGTLSHNPDLVNEVNAQVTTAWTRLGENVGYGPTVSSLQQAFMNSAPHRANILGDYNRVGIGVVHDGNGTIWVTLDFMNGPALPPPPPPPPPPPTWFLRNTLTTGVADSEFTWGDPGDRVVSCDWNGDGIDTAGIFRNGWWYLTNSNPAGSASAFAFGGPGDTPICGDWNGDGTDTVGVYRNGWFYLRNSNTSGFADLAFPYGNALDFPVVGDWNGDKTTTVGVMRDGSFYLRNSNSPGYADLYFVYGSAWDRPVAGDWNGDGTDTVGIWRNGALYLSNTNASGFADYVFAYGDPGDVPIIGDWAGTGKDVLGVVRYAG